MEINQLPMYSIRMASRLAGISKDRTRRWLKGYEYKYNTLTSTHVGSQKPIINRTNDSDEPFVTFIELIDLLYVKEFLGYGFSLQKIRKALIEAGNIIGKSNFANKIFFTDGKKLYLQIKDKSEHLIQLFSGGQFVIAPIIKELSHKIQFNKNTDIVERWYPFGEDGLIVIDPNLSFGKPIIINRGISTKNIYDLFIGENKNVITVCQWMELHPKEVNAAVAFEEKLKAA